MAKPRSCRVWLIRHHDGNVSGRLLRTWGWFFDAPAPAAYGASEDDVLARLDAELRERRALGKEPLDRYFWEEDFHLARVRVDVHPQSSLGKRTLVGAREVPFRLTYLWSELAGGGFRVLLPRFDWSIAIEKLEMAADVLRGLLGTALLGEHPRWIYELRDEGEESVREWWPQSITADAAAVRAVPDEMPTVRAVAEDWVDLAARHRLPAVLAWPGLSPKDAAQIARTPPPSLLVVGEPGVGRTTWVRGLAGHLLKLKREQGWGPRLWRTSGDRIVAGMVYLGQWQQRCVELVDELRHEGDFLYVDQLTSILAPQPDGASIAEMLLPAVEQDEISLIAECTDAELLRARQTVPALVAHAHIVRLQPPAQSEVAELVTPALARRAKHLRLHPAALRRVVRDLDVFLRHRAFPGKAFQLVEWLAREDSGHERTLLVPDVSAAFARWSGIPVALVADEVSATSASIAGELRQRVIGQDAACQVAAQVLARFKAGLNDPQKPLASLFFVGPTGVGKTELAKQLARAQFGSTARLLRVDMSEYAAPGSAGRLLQVGPGLTSLAEQVRQQPLSVVLLDEIEKAHPEVFDLLLGVLGEGRLSDSLGRAVDFRMTVLVLTSNVGTTGRDAAGLAEGSAPSPVAEVQRAFRPEFFNRLDHVVPFRRLDRADLARVLELEIAAAAARTGLERRHLRLVVEAAARERLVELGYDPQRGARPLQRALEQHVIAPLGVRLAGEPALRDGVVRVVAGDAPPESPDEIVIRVP